MTGTPSISEGFLDDKPEAAADAAATEVPQGPIFASDVNHDYKGAPLLAPYGDGGDLEAFFWANHDGDLIHKWHHYFPVYDRYLSRYRGTPVRFLEIGVFRGGSLAMWRDYLGPDATIFGIDIDERCAVFDGDHAQVRLGSQDDPAFLDRVIEEMGGVDVIIDDGSHMSSHIRASLTHLFPKLSDEGTYLIEDTHANYWGYYEGGHNTASSFISDVKDLIDDLHRRYHTAGTRHPSVAPGLYGMHVHDSVVVLEKRTRLEPPRSSMVGIDRFGQFNVETSAEAG